MTDMQIDAKIQQAKTDLLALGSMVEHAMRQAMGSLMNSNVEQSRRVLDNDRHINAKRYQLEIHAMKVISSFQPADKELRILTSIFELCSELERMGDYAKGIAAIHLRSGGIRIPYIVKDLDFMAQKVIEFLNLALTAFANEDENAARSIIQQDDLIDALYQQIYYEMMDYAMEKPEHIEQANYVIWVSHNLERMADRVTNICERTIYSTTGEIVEPFSKKDVLVLEP